MLFTNKSGNFYHDNLFLIFVCFVALMRKVVVYSIHLLRKFDFCLIYDKSYFLKTAFVFTNYVYCFKFSRQQGFDLTHCHSLSWLV